MSKTRILLIAACLLATALAANSSTANVGVYVHGQALVQFHPTVTQDRIEEILSDNGLAILRYRPLSNVYVIRTQVGKEIDTAHLLKRNYPREVEIAQLNYSRNITTPHTISSKRGSPWTSWLRRLFR